MLQVCLLWVLPLSLCCVRENLWDPSILNISNWAYKSRVKVKNKCLLIVMAFPGVKFPWVALHRGNIVFQTINHISFCETLHFPSFSFCESLYFPSLRQIREALHATELSCIGCGSVTPSWSRMGGIKVHWIVTDELAPISLLPLRENHESLYPLWNILCCLLLWVVSI